MSRVKKKLLGLIGLASVAVITAIAAVMPSVGTYAADSTSNISINVIGTAPGEFAASFTSPSNGASITDPVGTLTVRYANAKSITVTMRFPDGTTTTLSSPGISDPISGSLAIPYSLGEYGDYTFTITGVDMHDGSQIGSTITIHYHSSYFDITNPDEVETEPIAKVDFTPSQVCGVSFQLYSLDPGTNPNAPLLNPPYSLIGDAFASLPSYDSGTTLITIPFAQYGIPAGRYRIVMSTYDCTANHNLLEDNIERRYTYNPKGEILPPEIPDTGTVRIGGMLVAKKDIVLTGIIATIVVAAVILARKSRKQRKQ